jgi:hypothetical protein
MQEGTWRLHRKRQGIILIGRDSLEVFSTLNLLTLPQIIRTAFMSTHVYTVWLKGILEADTKPKLYEVAQLRLKTVLPNIHIVIRGRTCTFSPQ